MGVTAKGEASDASKWVKCCSLRCFGRDEHEDRLIFVEGETINRNDELNQ